MSAIPFSHGLSNRSSLLPNTVKDQFLEEIYSHRTSNMYVDRKGLVECQLVDFLPRIQLAVICKPRRPCLLRISYDHSLASIAERLGNSDSVA